MLKKFAVFIRHTFWYILFGCLPFTFACQKQSVEIFSSDLHTNVSFRISHPNNPEVRSTAGDHYGAFGLLSNHDTIWLKGQPTVLLQSEDESLYAWNTEVGQVQLRIYTTPEEVRFTFECSQNKLPITAWLMNLDAGLDEYYTGIFERVVDGKQDRSWDEGITTGLNLRGEKVSVKLRPTVSAYAPFYISSHNYAFFAHGTWPGEIDFCQADTNRVQISFEGPKFDFSLMLDDSPLKLVQRHAMASGPAFVPPKWTFGPWRWRDVHNNNKVYYDGSQVQAPYNSEVVEEVLMMKAYDIPCTAYWIDRPWGPGERGFDDYDIDTDRLPQFEHMVQWLNAQNIELMMWIGPFVMGNMADVAEEKNYHLQSKTWMNSDQVLMDFTNEEACRWWGENGPGKLARMGVKGFKLDRADGEKLADSLSLFTAKGTTYRENFNDYPRQYVKATYNAVQPVLGDDFVLFPRAQYTGSAKYGAMWAGDTGNPSEGLRSAVIGMQRCAVMGYPVWGSDTGGYPKKMQRDVTMRWMGFSCFSPIMEVGPTNNLAFWGMNWEPSFDQESLAIWRFYSKLRMSLMDYVYNAAQLASESGTPIARPLFLDYPEQKESWKDWSTYMFGNDLLVSAVWEEQQFKHQMYLPAGETWVDLWTQKEFAGGSYVEVDAPLHKIPVFRKKESALQLPDLNALYEESLQLTAVKYSMGELQEKAHFQPTLLTTVQ